MNVQRKSNVFENAQIAQVFSRVNQSEEKELKRWVELNLTLKEEKALDRMALKIIASVVANKGT